MLVCVVLSFSVLFLPVLSFSVLFLPVLSFSVLFIMLLDFSFSCNSSTLSFVFLQDELALFITLISCLVFFLSSFFTIRFSTICNLCIAFIFFLSYLVFSTSNLFVLYASYECSLIPIIIIILNWGAYPDRSFSCFMMLIYTSVFTLPFMYFLVWYQSIGGSFCFYSSSSSVGVFGSLLFLFVFGVKLPIYGLHFWLPIAHVEAPTFGSIVLAGVLLNLGGVGLIRILPSINTSILISFLLAYFILFTVYASLVCCSQSDFNRLVAYSSVAHIMLVPILVLSDECLSLNIASVGMFIHGLASPLMFILVSVFYSIFSTRQILLMRGLLTFSPLLSFISALSFFISISAPPFPGFVSEVYSFISISNISSFLFVVFIFVPFLSLLYNIVWLSSSVFSTPSFIRNNLNSFVCFNTLYPIFISIYVFIFVSIFFCNF